MYEDALCEEAIEAIDEPEEEPESQGGVGQDPSCKDAGQDTDRRSSRKDAGRPMGNQSGGGGLEGGDEQILSLAIKFAGIYKSTSSVTIDNWDPVAEIIQDFAVGIKAMSAAERTTVNKHLDGQDRNQEIESAIRDASWAGVRGERKFYKELASSLKRSGSENKKTAAGESKIEGEAIRNTGTEDVGPKRADAAKAKRVSGGAEEDAEEAKKAQSAAISAEKATVADEEDEEEAKKVRSVTVFAKETAGESEKAKMATVKAEKATVAGEEDAEEARKVWSVHAIAKEAAGESRGANMVAAKAEKAVGNVVAGEGARPSARAQAAEAAAVPPCAVVAGEGARPSAGAQAADAATVPPCVGAAGEGAKPSARAQAADAAAVPPCVVAAGEGARAQAADAATVPPCVEAAGESAKPSARAQAADAAAVPPCVVAATDAAVEEAETAMAKGVITGAKKATSEGFMPSARAQAADAASIPPRATPKMVRSVLGARADHRSGLGDAVGGPDRKKGRGRIASCENPRSGRLGDPRSVTPTGRTPGMGAVRKPGDDRKTGRPPRKADCCVSGRVGLVGRACREGQGGLVGRACRKGSDGLVGRACREGQDGLVGRACREGSDGPVGRACRVGPDGLVGRARRNGPVGLVGGVGLVGQACREGSDGLVGPACQKGPVGLVGGVRRGGQIDRIAQRGGQMAGGPIGHESGGRAAGQGAEKIESSRRAAGRGAEKTVSSRGAAGQGAEPTDRGRGAAGRGAEKTVSGRRAAGQGAETTDRGHGAAGRGAEKTMSGRRAAGQMGKEDRGRGDAAGRGAGKTESSRKAAGQGAKVDCCVSRGSWRIVGLLGRYVETGETEYDGIAARVRWRGHRVGGRRAGRRDGRTGRIGRQAGRARVRWRGGRACGRRAGKRDGRTGQNGRQVGRNNHPTRRGRSEKLVGRAGANGRWQRPGGSAGICRRKWGHSGQVGHGGGKMGQVGQGGGHGARRGSRARRGRHRGQAERRRWQRGRHQWRDGSIRIRSGRCGGAGPVRRQEADPRGHRALTARNTDVGDDVAVRELMLASGTYMGQDDAKMAGVSEFRNSGFRTYLFCERNNDETKMNVVVVADKGLVPLVITGVLKPGKLESRTYVFRKSGSLDGDTKYCPPAERRSVLGYAQFGNIPLCAQFGHYCEKREFEFWEFWESPDSREFEGVSANQQREHLTKAEVELTACLGAATTVERVRKTKRASAGLNLGSNGPIAVHDRGQGGHRRSDMEVNDLGGRGAE